MAIAEVGSGSQRSVITGSNVDSANGNFPGNVTAGGLLVVAMGAWSNPADTAITVTDSRSTPYAATLLASTGAGWGGGTGKPAIAYGIAASSGACTVTVDPDGTGNYFNAAIDEFSGADASPLDVDGGESTGTSTAPSDGVTTLNAGDLVIGVVAPAFNNATITPDIGTEIGEDETGIRQPYNATFQVVGAAGAQTASWTLSVSVAWSVYTAAFKESGAGAPVPAGAGVREPFGALSRMVAT